MASDQYTNHPPPEHVERESLLARIKRKAGFWLAYFAGALVIFVMIAIVYGTAGDMGLINTEMWTTNAGMLLGMVASWWLFGQWLKTKFGYVSAFG